MTDTLTAYRTCPLCEATCGLEITVEGGEVTGIRGDADDVFSHGFICPKGTALKQLHEDPDRLRTPLIRDATASWRGGHVGRGVRARSTGGSRRSSTSTAATRSAVYLGNPNAHNLGALLYGRVLRKALGTQQRLLGAARSTRCRSRSRAGLMFGGGARDPGARRRPHRLPADARRQPARVERQPR